VRFVRYRSSHSCAGFIGFITRVPWHIVLENVFSAILGHHLMKLDIFGDLQVTAEGRPDAAAAVPYIWVGQDLSTCRRHAPSHQYSAHPHCIDRTCYCR